jgi:hypothetical protein
MSRIVTLHPTVVLVLAAVGCRGADAPVQLAYRFEATQGTTFTAELGHEIDFSMGDHAMHGTREMRARYTVLGETARLDSIRASMIWGPNQQRIDTRHLTGVVFPLTVSATGGPPTYDATLPVVDMGGQAGGAVPASIMIDYGFPTLPTESVTTGSTWSETRSYPRLEAFMWVMADVTTTYRVKGQSTIDGTRCVEVTSESVGTLSEGSHDGEAQPYAGQLTGSATWCFDAASGVLVQVIGEEATDGASAGTDRPDLMIKQMTKIEIHNTATEGRE